MKFSGENINEKRWDRGGGEEYVCFFSYRPFTGHNGLVNFFTPNSHYEFSSQFVDRAGE